MRKLPSFGMLAVLMLSRGTLAEGPVSPAFAGLAKAGSATCKLVIADQHAFMEQRAAEEIARVILRDAGATLTAQSLSGLGADPEGTVILLGTAQSVPLVREMMVNQPDGIGDLPLLGPDGYAIQTLQRGKANYLIIAGATPRAVYYGAVYAGEQVILPKASRAESGVTVAKDELVTTEVKLSRSPAMAERTPYTLGFTGVVPEYTMDNWKAILDGMAREGINRVYFWWQSLYKPKAFPDRRNIDGGNARVRMTNADVNELARYAHQLGMEFLLGGGAFQWGGASALSAEYPEMASKGVGGLCPSNPKAQEVQTQFVNEMLQSIPEADGLWFEPRDEHGECQCEICQKPVDSLGSKQYGQSEITWFKQFAKQLWQKRPDAKLAWLIELNKSSKMHSEDPAYFEKIRQIKDPRIHWIVVWGAWEFPGPDGSYRPNTFFSRNNVWWYKPYAISLEEMQKVTVRAADMGLAGVCPAFEMCFSVDYHGAAIPYPMNKLPYELTSYAFREFSWEPSQTMDQFKAKMVRRYLQPDAPPQLVEDLIYLRQFALGDSWHSNRSTLLTSFAGEFIFYDGKPLANQDVAGVLQAAKGYNEADRKNALNRLEKRLRDLQQIMGDEIPKLSAIEARLDQFEPRASHRAQHTITLMREFITNTRRLLTKINMGPEQIEQHLKDVNAAREQKT